MLETGFVYSTFVDPLLGGFRKKVALEIKPGENVIDIACGTGEQLFELANKAASITGVDLSESMVQYATKIAAKRNITNATFFVCDATDLTVFYPKEFDVAILSLALHQFAPELQEPILTEINKISKRIVILDYAVPLPGNYVGIGSTVAEFLAGIEHNRNFKSYTRAGGLNAILPANGLTIQKSKLIGKGAFQIVTAHKDAK